VIIYTSSNYFGHKQLLNHEKIGGL